MPASSAEDVPAPLLARIIEALCPEQIWLFGSRARGQARPMSDWDLLVVVSDDASDDELDLMRVWQAVRDLLVVVSDDASDDELDLMRVWQAVRDLRIPADIIPVRRSDFEEARDHAG